MPKPKKSLLQLKSDATHTRTHTVRTYSRPPFTKGRSRNLSIFGPGALLEEEEQDVLLDRGGGKKASEPLILILVEKRHLQFFFVVFRFDVSSPPSLSRAKDEEEHSKSLANGQRGEKEDGLLMPFPHFVISCMPISS